MRDESRIREMYRQEQEQTLCWPAKPRTRLWQSAADLLLLVGVVLGVLALTQLHSLFLVGSVASVVFSWLLQRWEQRLVKQVTTERYQIRQELGCVVMGSAEHAGGIPNMKTYLRSSQPVVLGLSETHLTI